MADDIGLAGGVLEMCEKHLGARVTKWFLVLVVVTVSLACTAFIAVHIVYPLTRFFVNYFQGGHARHFSFDDFLTSLLNAAIGLFLYLATYWLITVPLRKKTREADVEMKVLRDEIKIQKKNVLELTEDYKAISNAYITYFEVINHYNDLRLKEGLNPVEFPERLTDEQFKRLLAVRNALFGTLPKS